MPVNVVGEFDDKGGLLGALGVDVGFLQNAFGETKDAFGLVGVAPGADVTQVKQRIKTLLDRQYPSIEVLTAQEFKDNQAGQVNQLRFDVRDHRVAFGRVRGRDRSRVVAGDLPGPERGGGVGEVFELAGQIERPARVAVAGAAFRP